MNEIVVSGLNTDQRRRFKALAKRAGSTAKAARIALRVGLLALDGEEMKIEVERELSFREDLLARRDAAEKAPEVIPVQQPAPDGVEQPTAQAPAGPSLAAAPPPT